jgi:hypothetical protein
MDHDPRQGPPTSFRARVKAIEHTLFVICVRGAGLVR